jgi:hypothetical protein
VDASVTIPDWDRQGLERLVRYCARLALAQERLGRLNAETLVYSLRKPTVDARMELTLAPLELLDRLARLVTPPRLHKHRYCGVLAPNAGLRRAVVESAGPAGIFGRAASRCWALLLARIYESLPLDCPRCGERMRIIAFVLDPPVIERILLHLGEPTEPPAILPARSPLQGEMVASGADDRRKADVGEFDQSAGHSEWPDMDQAFDPTGDSWA